jgi:hypothetical protein
LHPFCECIYSIHAKRRWLHCVRTSDAVNMAIMTRTFGRFAPSGTRTGFRNEGAPNAGLALISLFILVDITPGTGAC